MRVGLVGCVKRKKEEPAPARDLYTSALFEGGRRAVESSCDEWFILSAEHGLLEPDRIIEPYNETLNDASRTYRRRWSARVLEQLADVLGDLDRYVFEIHAGKDYYDFGLITGLRAAGATVEIPTEGLLLGQKLAYYRRARVRK